MGLFIKWDITYRCNLMCGHCINGNYLNNHAEDISYEDVIKIVDKIHHHIPIDKIQFLGGEPLVRKDFLDILNYLNGEGIGFGFNTNGLNLKPDTLNKIGEMKYFDNIVISLEGPDAKTNDSIRGKNVFHVIMEKVKLLRKFKEEHPKSAFRILINTVITSQNYQCLTDILTLCEKERVDEINLLEYIEEGNGVGKQLSLNRQQLLTAIESVAKFYTYQEKKLRIVPKFVRPLAVDYVKECLGLNFPTIVHGCGAGSSFIFLDNKGFIYPCDRQRNYTNDRGEILKDDFWNIWDSKLFSKPFEKYMSDDIYQNLEPCKSCKYLKNECFPCYLHIDSSTNTQMDQCVLFSNRISEVKKRVIC